MSRRTSERNLSDDGPVRRYHIETWGCQMNVHDSQKLAGTLEQEGLRPADSIEEADVVLLNTCAIREKAAEKVFSELGRLRRLKLSRPGMQLGVCGCVAQQEGAALFRRAPFVDFVVGPRATESLRRVVTRPATDHTRIVDTEYRDDSIRFPYDAIRREGSDAGKAFVTVIEGCNHRCTYCVVPRTRGKEICRPFEDVLQEVRALSRSDIVEVEFLGQTVNAYRDASGRSLADLLTAAATVDGIRRIRFTTSHPAQMTEPLIDAMARSHPKVCPYLHLPVQSGSSRVLRAMRRGYDRDGYLRKIEAIRRRIPEIVFGTDIIVGFPGETEDDFLATLDLLDAVGYGTVYSFAYSPRPGTRALEMQDEIPLPLKMERLARLQAKQKQLQLGGNRRWLGRRVEVLVEGPSKRNPRLRSGRTPENRIVHFPGSSPPGTLVDVEITGASAYSLRAEPLRGTA